MTQLCYLAIDNDDIEGMTRHALASVDTNILGRYDKAKQGCVTDGKCLRKLNSYLVK